MSKYVENKLDNIYILIIDIDCDYSKNEIEEVIYINQKAIDSLNELKIECFTEIIKNNNNLSEKEKEKTFFSMNNDFLSDIDFIDNYIKNLNDEEIKFYEDKKTLFEALGTDNYSFEDILKIDNKILEIEKENSEMEKITKCSGDFFISAYNIINYLDDNLSSNFQRRIVIDWEDTRDAVLKDYKSIYYDNKEFFYK